MKASTIQSCFCASGALGISQQADCRITPRDKLKEVEKESINRLAELLGKLELREGASSSNIASQLEAALFFTEESQKEATSDDEMIIGVVWDQALGDSSTGGSEVESSSG